MTRQNQMDTIEPKRSVKQRVKWKIVFTLLVAGSVGIIELGVHRGSAHAATLTSPPPVDVSTNALTKDLENPVSLNELGTSLTAKMLGRYSYTQSSPSVTMSDGVQLATTLYTPVGPMPKGGWPAVVMMHGWGGNRSEFDGIAPLFASHGFVVLSFDARGFGQSGGQTGLAGKRDILDVYQLMTWIIRYHQVSPSEIGLTGISYGGGRSFLAAADDSNAAFNDPQLFGTARNGLPPKVAAIAPIAGWTNLKYALFPDRIVKLSFDLGLYAVGAKPTSDNYPPELTKWLAEGLTGINSQDFSNALQARSVHTAGQWNSLAHTPMYAFQAWKDELFPAEQVAPLFEHAAEDPSSSLYNETAAKSDRLYFGSFGHAGATFGATEGQYVFQQVLYFMEEKLQTKTTPLANQGRVGIGPETWAGLASIKHYNSYPIANSSTDTVYLNGTTLSSNPPKADMPNVLINNPTDGNFSDPNLTPPLPLDSYFQTATAYGSPSSVKFYMPLSASYHLQGEPTVTLYLRSVESSAEVTVRLYDYSPSSGKWTFITRGADLATHLSALTPTRIKFNLYSANHVFPAGDKLVLEISPTDTPFFQPDETSLSLVVDHSTSLPSHIRLPSISG